MVVPLGLAILATEFAWARRIIRRGGAFLWQSTPPLARGKQAPPKYR